MVAAFLALAPASALAGPGLYITLHNDLPAVVNGQNLPVRVALHNHGGSDCWHDNDLAADMNSKSAGLGQSVTYYTEKQVSGPISCWSGSGTRGIALYVDEGGGFQIPAGHPSDLRIHYSDSPAPPGEQEGFNFLDSLRTWLPRIDGRGLLCWRTVNQWNNREGTFGTGHVDVHVLGDPRCNALRSATIPPGTDTGVSAPVRAPAGAAAGVATPIITTLGQLARQACNYGSAIPNRSVCPSAVSGNWVLDNLTTNVSNFEHSAAASGDPMSPVAHNEESIPPGGSGGQVAVENSVNFSFEDSTTTSFGWGLTEELGFESKVKVGLWDGKLSGSISSDQDWSTDKEHSESHEKETSLHIEADAEPGYTTRLDVFTPKRDATYTYTADLGFGKSGDFVPSDAFEPVVTPVPSVLDMTSVTRLPCLAVVVGDDTVRNSIMNINQELINSGVSPTDPTLPADERGFLKSAPHLSAHSICPGFPSGFASTASFQGAGSGQFSAFGYQPDGSPVVDLVGCVSRSPYPPSGASRPASGADEPCQSVPVNGGTVNVTPANLIDARRRAGGSRRLLGTNRSDTVLGGPRGEKIDARAGTFDRVEAGGGPDRVRGGPGQDWIYAGRGNDVLSGGSGRDYATGGPGRDRLSDRRAGYLLGDAGNDRLSGKNLDGTLDGGAGDDLLIGRGRLRRTSLGGGRGNDRYVLRGRGVPQIVELPGAGYDRIETRRSVTVPAGVERASATGGRRVRLHGGFGAQKLVGNRARNVLRGGPGADRLSGKAGNDTLILGDDAFDTARGGPGADRFVPTGSPQRFSRPAGAVPRRRRAHRISDFNPRAGDRLVLRRSVFGPELTQLSRRFLVVRGRNPRPKRSRATLLFDTRRHLLSFDRDGTGPLADKVIAILPAAHTVSRSYVMLSRR